MTKRFSLITIVAFIAAMVFILAACTTATETQSPPTDIAQPAPTEPPPTEPPPTPTEIQITGTTDKGGKLYDKWWKELGIDEPTEDQPLWSSQSTNTRSGSATWRCKECHGWDYKGAEGAYGSGSHFTGFPGVLGSADSMTALELLNWLDGTSNPEHDFTIVGDEALGDLVIFLSEGLENVEPYINDETKEAVGGNLAHGEELFNSFCIACHGTDGKTLNFGSDEEPEYVGTIAVDNPWEFIHKVRAGQPGSQPQMPSAIVSGWSMQDVVDVLTFAQTLPTGEEMTEDTAQGSVSNGGMLYDKWWTVTEQEEPVEDMPVWARQDTNTRSGSATWRCKECHGWDYMGADGAYGSGSHFTGFPGVLNVADKSSQDLLAQLTGGVDSEHDFSILDDSSLADLITFLQEGLIDLSTLIDYETKTPIGAEAGPGEELFTANCLSCHGEDGRKLNFGSTDEPEYVGTIAVDNPWEFIHKVRFGQPGTAMPSGLDLEWDIQDFLNLLAFAQSLPVESP